MQSEEGLLLLKKNCYACHNPNTTSHEEFIAPMQGIKENYLRAYPSREALSQAMESFVGNPIEEKALMKGPVKRFGLIPKPAVSDVDLQKIIAYIHDNNFETPNWLGEHTTGGHL